MVNREHDPCSPDAAEKPKHQDPCLDGYAMYKKEGTVRPGSKYVQIIHVNGNHWVTVSNVTAPNREVQIYDSGLPSDVPVSTQAASAPS